MLTWVEIKKSAVNHNLSEFKKLLGRGVEIWPVVKANAYGHGFFEIAKICAQSKDTDKIAVVNLSEAVALIKAGIKKPLIILSFYENDASALSLAVKAGVIFPLYSLEQAKMLNAVGKKLKKIIKVHLKIDTGAGRLGILPEDTKKFALSLKKFSFLNVEGIFSHFASSEDDRVYTDYQLKRFEEIVKELEKSGFKFKYKHLSCSAASVLYEKSRLNAVRLGLSLYGLYPDELSKRKIKLQPVLSWQTKIIQIKTVPAWSKIGYGGTFTTKKPTKIAVLPVGYYDGYVRALSNRAEVLINGKLCPVRGRICMNICMVDVTGLKNVRIGDRATLLGVQNKEKITADDLARSSGTINYEAVDRINPLLPRILV